MVAQPPAGDNGAPPPGGGAAKKAVLPPAELSAEDAELRDNLLLCVQRVTDPDAGVATLALETLRTEIRTATRCVPMRLRGDRAILGRLRCPWKETDSGRPAPLPLACCAAP